MATKKKNSPTRTTRKVTVPVTITVRVTPKGKGSQEKQPPQVVPRSSPVRLEFFNFANSLIICTFAKKTKIMPYTIAITNDTPQALAYVEKAKKLAQPTRILTKKEKEFKDMLLQGLKEMKDIRAGKIKAGNLDELLNEL